ncbi:MAG: TerB family tellurite resistance protein [Nitratireductor sp.]|nr:TerB family tellurite resistance protein [Nitratireductor sp.]
MFEALKSLFGADDETNANGSLFGGPDDVRLASAALMFHVINADGVITDDERARMKSVLESEFSLSSDEVDQLYQAAQDADSEAIDLYRFTSTLKRQFDHAERIKVVENLWEMVFADGELHELEDHVLWRIAELLEIERNDRIALKQRVRERHGIESDFERTLNDD